ncbi:ATP-binding cassette domain-containing protein [Streptomyces sp. PTM05]|uniref:ATP-binding cassette domain-containing protein n=1 Tax=Streptantibioticus parmotrematis TaxID=2873249 RepID=A0ABS7QWP9_9ACTN|nr:ATP-binding cassette domain-containing protein [Streptantibioticus parmotrematis]MBY8886184.1 ATP-binding cassette domain-containing protein [Streptantibioticus parmotrematis]
MTDRDTGAPRGAAVQAEGFGLKGPRGWVFRGVTLDAPPGTLIAVEGASGSGRTCLLLSLTGRMRATEGRAEVGGVTLPKHLAAVRRFTATGPVEGVAELDPALTVAEHLRERALLQRRFDGSPLSLLRPRKERAARARARIDEALESAGLDLDTLPKGPRTSVRDLERLEALRLGVALALIQGPRLLAVDDADHKLASADRAAAWALLRAVADSGITVVAACTEAPESVEALTVRLGAAQEHAEEDPQDTGATENTGDTEETEEGAADAYAEAGRA